MMCLVKSICASMANTMFNVTKSSYYNSPHWLTHRCRGRTCGSWTWACPSSCSSSSSSFSCSPGERRKERWQSPEWEDIWIAGFLNEHLEFQLVVFVVEEECVDDPIAKRVDGQLGDSQQVLLNILDKMDSAECTWRCRYPLFPTSNFLNLQILKDWGM